jgi:hypothetical protein
MTREGGNSYEIIFINDISFRNADSGHCSDPPSRTGYARQCQHGDYKWRANGQLPRIRFFDYQCPHDSPGNNSRTSQCWRDTDSPHRQLSGNGLGTLSLRQMKSLRTFLLCLLAIVSLAWNASGQATNSPPPGSPPLGVPPSLPGGSGGNPNPPPEKNPNPPPALNPNPPSAVNPNLNPPVRPSPNTPVVPSPNTPVVPSPNAVVRPPPNAPVTPSPNVHDVPAPNATVHPNATIPGNGSSNSQ